MLILLVTYKNIAMTVVNYLGPKLRTICSLVSSHLEPSLFLDRRRNGARRGLSLKADGGLKGIHGLCNRRFEFGGVGRRVFGPCQLRQPQLIEAHALTRTGEDQLLTRLLRKVMSFRRGSGYQKTRQLFRVHGQMLDSHWLFFNQYNFTFMIHIFITILSRVLPCKS